MNAWIHGTKLTALMGLNVMMTTMEGCSLDELFPVQQFTQDFILGWVSALLF